MSDCKKCRSLFLERFYGELDAVKTQFFNDHISVCEKCKSRFAEMEELLQFTGQRVRPEPPEEFWDAYEKSLARRIETEKIARHEHESLGKKRHRRFILAPKWAYQAAAAVALIVIGIFIGRSLFSPSIKGVQHASQRSGLTTRQQPETALVHRSQNYIERSKLILLALVNFDPVSEDPYALDLPYQKRLSRKLVQEAGTLKQELAESDQERLEALITGLEMILLQIANLESENDLDAIELVRDGIDRRGILMEINLTDLRLSRDRDKAPVSSEQPRYKPNTI